MLIDPPHLLGIAGTIMALVVALSQWKQYYDRTPEERGANTIRWQANEAEWVAQHEINKTLDNRGRDNEQRISTIEGRITEMSRRD